MFQNYPEGLQCVLAGQKEIEEVMSLFFKPYYPGASAATQPNHFLAAVQFGHMENEMDEIFPSILSSSSFLWLKQLIWEEGSFKFGKKMSLMGSDFQYPQETILWSV